MAPKILQLPDIHMTEHNELEAVKETLEKHDGVFKEVFGVLTSIREEISEWRGEKRLFIRILSAACAVFGAFFWYSVNKLGAIDTATSTTHETLMIVKAKQDDYTALPRYTKEMSDRDNLEQEAKIKEYMQTTPPTLPAAWTKAKIEDHEVRLHDLENKVKATP